jgi:diguanylate cyclase (GGDEF)-like protein/PAS domain S-box-containing protein
LGQRFRPAAFNLLPEQIAIVNEQGVIIDVNDTWRQFARRNGSPQQAEHAVGVNYLEVCDQAQGRPDGEEASAARDGIQQVLQLRIPSFHLEYPCHSPSERRWFQMNVTLLDRESPVVAVSHLDITRRKEAEIAQQREHGMLQGLFDLAPLGISLVDLNTLQPVNFNAALCDMLGYTRDELLIASARRPAIHQSPDERQAYLNQGRCTGRCGPVESVFIRKDGSRIDVLQNGTRILGPDGTPYLWSIEQDITRRKVMDRELRAAAELDRLTGLANRTVLLRRLQQYCDRSRLEPGFCFAVLFLDFDRFKIVNDTLGHEAGDELLTALAQRLSDDLVISGAGKEEGGSFAARFGGDEFVYVAAGINGIGEARGIAERLQAAVSATYHLTSQTFQSTASIGIAMGSPGAGGPHDLLRNADTAMYEAKRLGRGNTVLFDVSMHDRLTRAMRIEAGLRLALLRNELTVYYQPIVDLGTGHMIAVEALLRWDHPELGRLPPDEFIPIAEETGLIVPIGEWVLRQSCLQWARWQREDPHAAPPGVSVNLSRRQMLLGTRFLLAVHAALHEAGMPSSALQLEITEREVMRDPVSARDLLLGLSAIGVRLAMDDFGTGTSSLGCLRDYPFQTIKIDKSFITDLSRDPHVLALAHATVSVIGNLGMISVAEGVETPQQVAMLQAMGCRHGQGYLFGRPMPADRLLSAMRDAGPAGDVVPLA